MKMTIQPPQAPGPRTPHPGTGKAVYDGVRHALLIAAVAYPVAYLVYLAGKHFGG